MAKPKESGVSDAPAADLASWVALIDLARKINGRAAARALWAKSPLAALPEPELPERASREAFFVEACTATGEEKDELSAGKLLAEHLRWCKERRLRPMTGKALGLHVAALPGVTKRKSGTVRYCGIKLARATRAESAT